MAFSLWMYTNHVAISQKLISNCQTWIKKTFLRYSMEEALLNRSDGDPNSTGLHLNLMSMGWATNMLVLNQSNGGDDQQKYFLFEEQRPETYIVPVVFFIIFVLGVIGNCSLIYILLRHKSMRSISNTFIFNIAIGDLLLLLCTVPFFSIIYTFEVCV